MLKKENRLGRAGFSHYFKIGKRTNNDYLTIITHPSPTLKGSVVVGKKVYKKAVDRNKLKRRIYATLTGHLKQPQVLIVIVKPKFSSLTKKAGTQIIKESLPVALN